MKTRLGMIALPLLALGLSGCAVYGPPPVAAYPSYPVYAAPAPVVVAPAPVYFGFGLGFHSGGHWRR